MILREKVTVHAHIEGDGRKPDFTGNLIAFGNETYANGRSLPVGIVVKEDGFLCHVPLYLIRIGWH